MCAWCHGVGAVDSGGITPWGAGIDIPCHCTANTVEQWKDRCEKLEAERKRLRDGIDYWSYCMSQGMLQTCPEKVDQLTEFLMSCKIAPWYIRTRTLETVKSR